MPAVVAGPRSGAGNFSREREVRNLEVCLRRVAGDQPWIVLSSQHPGGLTWPDDFAIVRNVLRKSDRRWQTVPVRPQRPHDRTVAGGEIRCPRDNVFLTERLMRNTGEHLVATGGMGLILCDHCPKYGQLVCVDRCPRHEFSNSQARHHRINPAILPANFLRCQRFGIPCFVLGRPTQQPQQNHRLCGTKPRRLINC